MGRQQNENNHSEKILIFYTLFVSSPGQCLKSHSQYWTYFQYPIVSFVCVSHELYQAEIENHLWDNDENERSSGGEEVQLKT